MLKFQSQAWRKIRQTRKYNLLKKRKKSQRESGKWLLSIHKICVISDITEKNFKIVSIIVINSILNPLILTFQRL